MKGPFYHIFRYTWMCRIGIFLPPLLAGVFTHVYNRIHPCTNVDAIFALIFLPVVISLLVFVVSLLAVEMLMGWMVEDMSYDEYVEYVTKMQEKTND